MSLCRYLSCGSADSIAAGQCQHAVLMTCLHLAHEMNMREVGQYAWLQPQGKDPQGSMLKIMKSRSSSLAESLPLLILRLYQAYPKHGQQESDSGQICELSIFANDVRLVAD